MLGGGDLYIFYAIVIFERGELARWYPPPPKKKKIFFGKSEGEEIEKKEGRWKMDVGGGGRRGMCNYFMQL